MSPAHVIQRRMLLGTAFAGAYGVWVATARLPEGLGSGAWLGASFWTIVLLAVAGGGVAGGAGLVALAVHRIAPGRRAAVAGAVETLLLLPLITWLVLNEFVVSTTSQVLGIESLTMVWYNTYEVFEAAWAMGRRYLLLTGILALAAGLILFIASRRSFQPAGVQDPAADPAAGTPTRRRFALVSPLTAGVTVVALVIAWPWRSPPSEALTTALRSAPPLRALNLTRAVVGIDLDGPAPAAFGSELITDATYQQAVRATRVEDAPNVVLIMLESVPAGALHCYGYHREDVSPNLDRLAEEGVLFEHCLAPASFSSYGIVSTITGLYLLRDRRYDYFRDTDFPFMGLPRALRLAGYETALFSSGNETFDNINHFYPPEDFDTYFSHDTTDIPKKDSMRMDDRHAGTAFEAWMARRRDRRPFYVGFYLQSTHFNYEVPEPWASHYQPTPPLYSSGDAIIRIPPDLLPGVRNQYDNALRYADHWVGRIRDAIDRAGELDNTLIVVVADHGEGFMEHGLARHGVHVWEEMIHVPLIFHAGASLRASLGDRLLPSRVPDTVSNIDIAPTVAGVLGIPPHPSWQGHDVLAPGYTSHNRPVFSLLQLTRWQEVLCINRFKYIYDLTDVEAMLFDLETDPGETHDLIDEEPELAAVLHEVLAGWHNRQLHYYDRANRPFTHYIGRYEPPADLLDDLARLSAHRRPRQAHPAPGESALRPQIRARSVMAGSTHLGPVSDDGALTGISTTVRER